jgi:hypothetical protein
MWCGLGHDTRSVVSRKFFEEQLQILRLDLALNYPSDKDLSLGTPETRQIPLRMTNLQMTNLYMVRT